MQGLSDDPRPLQPKVLEATLGDSVLFYFSGAWSRPPTVRSRRFSHVNGVGRWDYHVAVICD